MGGGCWKLIQKEVKGSGRGCLKGDFTPMVVGEVGWVGGRADETGGR